MPIAVPQERISYEWVLRHGDKRSKHRLSIATSVKNPKANPNKNPRGKYPKGFVKQDARIFFSLKGRVAKRITFSCTGRIPSQRLKECET
jgi:hypothetical protein